MLPTTTHSAPSVGDFIPYPEYEATTPESFHDGKPVLRYHATGVKVCVPKDQLTSLPIFPADAPVFEGDSGELVFQEDVELFINSQDLAIFNHQTNTGIQIPYPSIALHAMQHKAQPSTEATNGDGDASKTPCVLLQLDLSDGGEDDETYDTVQLTLVPPTASTQFESPAQDGAEAPSEQEKMFDAITICQNLHPDPAAEEDEDDDDDQDYSDRIIFEPALDFAAAEAVEGLPGVFRGTNTGDLPPPMPGSSTWITAENVSEFFDENGNWIGGGGAGDEDEDEEKEGADQEGGKEHEVEQLGPGAGRVRALDELNDQEQAADESESKRARVE